VNCNTWCRRPQLRAFDDWAAAVREAVCETGQETAERRGDRPQTAQERTLDSSKTALRRIWQGHCHSRSRKIPTSETCRTSNKVKKVSRKLILAVNGDDRHNNTINCDN